MAIIVNPKIIGDGSANTLTNSNKGYTYMSGQGGDDTYVVENISNSFSEINPTETTTTGNNADNVLQIQNLKGNDLTLFFDVEVNPTGNPDDNLFVVKKNLLKSVTSQVSKFQDALLQVENANPTYTQDQIYQAALEIGAPQKGAVQIDDYFGETNNTPVGNYGDNYIEIIQTIDKNGITRTLNVEDYVTTVTTQVREFLTENGYTSVANLMSSSDTSLQNQLMNIYKNQLINLTIEGVENTNDKLVGENGNDTFVFGVNSGDDTVVSGRGDDSLQFENEIFSDLVFTRDKNNLVISHNENDDTVTIQNYLSNPTKSSIKTILTTDAQSPHSIIEDAVVQISAEAGKKNRITGTKINDSITGSTFDDILKGSDGNDSIIGGLGNDKLYGDAGENTLYFTEGDGLDSVYSGKGEDTLYLTNVDSDNIVYSASTSGGLILNYADNSSVEIVNYFRKKGDVSIQSIYTSTDDLTQTLDNIVSAEDFVIQLDGVVGKKNRINGTYLNDVITGQELADNLNGLDGNDSITGNAGNDNINGGNGNDTLYGNDGNDIIKGGNGADSIYGNAGDDKLYGESGQNTFFFEEGDGNDTIYMGKGLDSLSIDSTDISYYRNKNNLVINYGTETDSVTVSNYFRSNNPSVDMVNDLSLSKDIIIEGYNTVENGVTVKQYNGNDYGNLIYADGRYDLVNAGDGDDVIQVMSSKSATINSGDGNDYIEVKSLKQFVEINDTSGTDTLMVNEKTSNTNIIFNVLKDTTATLPEDEDSLYIVNDSNWKRIARYQEVDEITGGIEIESITGIERIETKDGYVTATQIDEVKANVTAWLANTNYDSAMQALEEGNENIVNQLLAIYENIDWQAPALV
ncbi:MAG: calcium-binding protein [Candidatus Gastranaerophilales bacterium]|nr:calcium-binding protein [Candidatus Gastranaerophilales bacterium]